MRKVFEVFHDVFRAVVPDRDAFLQEEPEDDSIKKFVKAIRKDERRYTMGDMAWILSLARRDGKTRSRSKLLQKLGDFAEEKCSEYVTSVEFTDALTTVTDFRNRAAHPDTLEKDVACDCRDTVRKLLIRFLGCCRG